MPPTSAEVLREFDGAVAQLGREVTRADARADNHSVERLALRGAALQHGRWRQAGSALSVYGVVVGLCVRRTVRACACACVFACVCVVREALKRDLPLGRRESDDSSSGLEPSRAIPGHPRRSRGISQDLAGSRRISRDLVGSHLLLAAREDDVDASSVVREALDGGA